MRVRVTVPADDGIRIWEKVLERGDKVEKDEQGEAQWDAVSDVGPLLPAI